MNPRVERLRAEIEAPLLVTKPVNVGYLTGLASSNAALLVEPDSVRVFTDFRYVEKARLLGLEVTPVSRNLFSGMAEHLPKRVEFEAENLTYAAWAVLDRGGIELVPRHELLETVRCGEGARPSSTRFARPPRSPTRSSTGSPSSSSSAEPSATWPGGSSRRCTSSGPTGRRST